MAKLEKETRLKLAIFLSLIFMCIEIVGGYLANSIAIFSDAAHLLTDIAGFIIALIATIAAKSPGTKTLTFGMARAEVFGALGSVMSLWVITAFLLYAAFFRAIAWFEGTAESVDGFLMFSVACFGVLVNLCLGYVFHEDHGGAFHPSHSHDHGHSCSGGHGHHEAPSHSGYQQVSTEQSQPAKKAEAAGHDHSHDHKSKGSDHSHSHEHTETTPLLPNVGSTGKPIVKTEPFAFTKAAKCTGHAHDSGSHRLLEATPEKPAAAPASKCASNGHDHSHDHHSHAAHDHSERDIESARIKEDDHGHDHGHAHSSYGSSGGHTDSHDHGAHSGHAHHASDVNLEAAYLHVLTDLIQSVGVAIAGAVLWWRPDWQIIDPVCTVLFSIVALNSTLPLINKVAMILFEGTPAHVDWEIVMGEFQKLPGVEDVHDLHIWSISSNSISLTCHIRAEKPQETLLAAHKVCRRLGIDHATIQVHDAGDSRFCYSETCDDAEVGGAAAGTAGGAGTGSSGKRKACV